MSLTNLVRSSRDGDQFHYLWAARRCLHLIAADSDLTAISIEGPSLKEQGHEPPVTEGEEVIDLAEYFGSEKLQTARLVRYMQLKHSTRQATEPWTASGLEKSITGFAKRYRELLATFTVAVLALKLEFWFVTNRPISTDFAEAVADAAAEISPRHPTELKKLEKFAGLNGRALSDFAKLLRFEGRQDDYWEQRNILSQEVRGYLAEADASGPLQLSELVKRRALSEGELNPTITKKDVERALNTDETSLFPAPCLVETFDQAVPRDQESLLINAITEAASPVVIHASAGVGKTVFATRIARGLPPGSSSVLYDCYGNGLHRNPSNYRHRHKDALVQIANELASKGLCHPLIPTSRADPSDYMRAFVYRVDQAALHVNLTNSSALLCIVIDAADNAQMAAEEVGEARSFVRDLIRQEMPDNVRLVFLCRSHRQDHLDPPVKALRLELRPFGREETAAHLRQRFSDASGRDVDEFHRLSSHNPRVQALALSRNDTLSETLRLLGPNPTTVEDTIGSLLGNAIEKLKDSVGQVEKAQIDRICAGLASLRPLIPIPVLSKMAGVDPNAIKSFAIDLGRPLLVAGDTIQFFDEPAETWFRETSLFRPTADAMQEFIANLRPLSATSAYVASVLPQLMLEAGNLTELVDLALTSAALPETNPLERRDVELQRLQFALKAGLRSKRYLDAAKLALKAGGEMAGEDRQRKSLLSNTDLAATFLETDLIQETVSRRTFGSGWLGSHYAYEAALMSGRPELAGDARSRLRIAYEWLRNWSRLTPEERKEEEVSAEDIVELTLAHINIHGPADGARSLGSWRPRELSFRVGRTVARRLIDHGRIEDTERFARAAGNNLCLVLAVTVELREVHRTLPSDVMRRAVRLIGNPRVQLKQDRVWDDSESELVAVTAIVEAALQQEACEHDSAIVMLSRYLPKEPPRNLASRFAKSRVPLLRAYCLRAALQGRVLELRDLAHSDLKASLDQKNEYSTSRDLQDFRESVGSLLPWHQLWAAANLELVSKESLPERITMTLRASSGAVRHYHTQDDHITNEIALLWFDVLYKLNATSASGLTEFWQWKNGLARPLFAPTLTALARLCGQKEETKATALQLALEAFNLAQGDRADAETKSEIYVDLARSILVVSKPDAQEYFNKAAEVASKIGDENLSRWDAILDLAERAALPNRPAPETAYNFARCAELTYDYVARDKHFDWRSTVRALCDLCPSSALTIQSRWRDRGFGWSERILPIAVTRLIEVGVLDPRDALPLLGFRAKWSYDEFLDRVLSSCKTDAEKSTAAEFLFRYARFSEAEHTQISTVAARYGITRPGLDELVAFEQSSKEIEEKDDTEVSEHLRYKSSEAEKDWETVFGGYDLSTPDGLSRSFSAFKRRGPPFAHDQFFEECIKRLSIGSEPGFVEAFGSVPEFDLYHLRSWLKEIPESWRMRPAIRRAMQKTLKAICRRYYLIVSKNRYYEVFPFEEARKLAEISEADIVDVVLAAIGETPSLADTTRLFSLVGLLATKLSEDEALEALRFGLSLFDAVLDDKDGDGPWSTQLLPPTDLRASLAGYVWASMAAPEGVLRWEGSHVVLGLAALERRDVLSHLMHLAANKQGGPFVDARLPFYQLHALQWLLIGITRAAGEYPAVLTTWVSQIVDWALEGQKHVLIRQFAARAALAVFGDGMLPDKEGVTERLRNVNLTSLPVVKSKSSDFRHSQSTLSVDDEDQFYFGIDFGPYWYAPLGRVFGLSQGQIEASALQVIRNDLGFRGKGGWKEDERGQRKLYQEDHTYHSHGSFPRADTLHFYYGYHAMMIVAGDLLQRKPTHENYGEEDSFREWLDGYDLSRKDGRWLWDRRDPTPLERPSWQNRRRDDVRWRTIGKDDFSEALRPGDMLNIWGDWTQADPQRQQSVHVSSALVTSDKALALLRALRTAKNVHDYAIPSAGSDMEIDKSGFSLKGWITDNSRERGLDGQDRWAGGISFPPPGPASDVVDLMDLQTDADRRVWTTTDGTIVMASQVWGYYDEGKRHESSSPEGGSRLQVSADFLTAMLTKLDRKLIIEVQIARRRRHRAYESSREDDKEVPTSAKLYLFGSDGRLDTL